MTSEVTQAARDAAIELAALLFGNGHSVTVMLKETPRHFMLDAFARFERETIAHLAHRGGEVVATIRFDRSTSGNENEMPKVISCNWMPDGEYHLYAAPPTDEVARLREALQDVVNPLAMLQRQAEAEGNQLSGMAYSIANDLHFVQSIASQALGDTP